MPNTDHINRILQAAQDVAEQVAEAFSEKATAFTCSEIEVLAELMRAVGKEDYADNIIDSHAEGDDEGDAHWNGVPTIHLHNGREVTS